MTTPDPIAAFDGKRLSYTYDNGWSFTNDFEGHLRITNAPRGLLKEHVEVAKLREGLYFISWVDDEMGLIAQTIDFENKIVLAAIPVEGELRTEILKGRITDQDG